MGEQIKELKDMIADEPKGMEKGILVMKSLYRTNEKKLPEAGLLHVMVERIENSLDRNIEIVWAFQNFSDLLD